MSLSINGNYDEQKKRWSFDLIGEIDISNAHQLRKQLEAAYDVHPSDIYLDLDKLNYIDSTGLGVIIGVYGAIRGNEHKTVILNPKDNVKKLLRITSLDKVLIEQ
ncbi:MAG: STAS domain-containing protein [Clostridiales Family XIII bacterium]|jgi:anti-sigma B factor antagonist|nr:STAS domain-containing protein [Clostridiales Family XIII bacterium]